LTCGDDNCEESFLLGLLPDAAQGDGDRDVVDHERIGDRFSGEQRSLREMGGKRELERRREISDSEPLDTWASGELVQFHSTDHCEHEWEAVWQEGR
jgi:hypothetical protein